MLRFARARYSRARFGPLDLFEDIWYWHNGTSGSKMALESDSGPAVTLLAALPTLRNAATWMLRPRSQRMFKLLADFVPK